MAENNSEEKKQVSTTGSDKTGKAVPTKRAVQMIDEMKSPTKPLPLAKKNWSWPSFIVVLGYIIGVAVGSMQKYSVGGDTGTRILFLIAIFFLGSLGGVLVYNLGKWIGARISGYQLSYICISGLCWDRSRADKRVYFDGSQFLELHSRFTPKDENIDRDPAVMLILGYVVWAILFVVVLSLGLTVVSTSNSGLKWGMVFGSALSASYVLYQICPFRQDYPSDMFAFISTREKENREAFNIYYYNRGREFSDVEMLVPNFSSFDSYWKAKTLIYVFRSHLYKSDEIELALKTFTQLHAVSGYLNDEERSQIAGERLFVLILLNDRAGADNLFIELPRTIKNEVIKSTTLSSFRTSLLVSGVIVGREDATADNVKTMLKVLPAQVASNKLKTEKSFYRVAYEKVKQTKPSFALPALD